MSPALRPHLAPLALLLVIGLVAELVRVENPVLPWVRHAPELWAYPLQILLCGGLIWWWRTSYSWGDRSPQRLLIGVVAGIVGIVFWIYGPTFGELPQGGFDPTAFGDGTGWIITGRFFRLAVLVPFVEEIFWRGYLQPTLTRARGPLLGVLGTAVLVALAHQPSDWLIAFGYGALAGVVYLWTKSLAACIAMHATANLILGIYILQTGHWHLW